MKPDPLYPQSTLGSWSATIIRALDARGLDGDAVARRAGIDPASLADADFRVPRQALTRLWELAVEETGNEAFGLEAPRFAMQTTFHALGYAVLASATFREALERMVRHRRLIGNIIQFRIEEGDGRSRIVIDVSAGHGIVPPQAVDAVALLTARQARALHGGADIRPLAVSLERPRPEDPSPWERALRAPVAFDQPANALEFATEVLDRRVPAANAELARQNDEVVVRYLARLESGTVLGRTRRILLELLPGGTPGRDEVARRLGMSPRSLQRQLAAEDTTFKDVLADARLTLARSYLEEGRMPVTEIAFVLGFAETSAFTRAFRRWTGLAPTQYARKAWEQRSS